MSEEATAWTPSAEQAESYRIAAFSRRVGLDNFSDLIQRAETDPEWYYPAALEFLGWEWMTPPTDIRDESEGIPFTRWFPGAETNVAWLAADRWRGLASPALIHHTEAGTSTTWTFDQLADKVARVATGLLDLGIGQGDAVGMYLPPVPEAVVLTLALGRIGAIAVPMFSGFGVDPIAERLTLSGARAIVTGNGTIRRGKPIEMTSTALAAAAATGVEHVIVVDSLRTGELPEAGQVAWTSLQDSSPQEELTAFEANTPWIIMFTSGSTGRPKATQLTQGAFTASLSIELAFQADVRPGDLFCWPADMGWMAGLAYTTIPLILGSGAVLFEGAFDHPAPDVLWQLVDRYGITQLGFGPTVARMLAEAGEAWVTPYALSTLRTIPSGGEPWTLPAWEWVARHVGRGRAPIINWCGGTEIGGSMVSGYPHVETPAMRFSGPVLGVATDVVDVDGDSVVEAEGELAMRRTAPGVTPGFWNDNDRYLETYWSTIDGVWIHGDRAVRHADGSFSVIGRSDDVLKVAGKRIGPSELESKALTVPGVTTAAAIGVPDAAKGEVAVLVVTTDGDQTDSRLAADVSEAIAASFGKPLRPKAVLVVPELPRTRSGKIHRRVLRSWLNGDPPGDLTSLENPEVEAGIAAAGLASGVHAAAVPLA